MVVYRGESSASSFLKKRPLIHIVVLTILGLLVVWIFCSIARSPHNSLKEEKSMVRLISDSKNCINPGHKTFYDDPSLGYKIEKPIKNWDEKRRNWLKQNPSHATEARDRILIVTGSQPSACKNPFGDHLLLRLFKNKVDYSRINGHDVFYNNALLHPKMGSYWAKISGIRAAMVAHPEAEWIWWVDSDAVFTDMDFQPPMKKYEDYNLIMGGWPKLVYETPSWLGLNAGVFYIRNCQWSIDFLEEWAKLGPQSIDSKKWAQIIKAIPDRTDPHSCDQTAMVYLLLKQRCKWGDKVLLEHEHCIQGYWEPVIRSYDNVTRNYQGLEQTERKLKRSHAEKVNRAYTAMWEKHLENAGYKNDAGKRPCITHFTGCQQCSGNHNPAYKGDSCWKGMEMALNFADNQVLRNYGFGHADILDPASPLVPV